jgi:nucleolar protein 58
VLSLSEYRKQLFEYLQNRMQALAPNLTALTGELVGARLLAHSGSLMNLAKQPASTIQILGAEKALFRALKTKHDTPKYGLIYHASLVGQAAPKHKGKISRVLAAKCALAVRVDALTEDDLDASVGIEGRQKVEMRLRQLEGGAAPSLGASITAKKTGVYHPVAAKTASTSAQYNSTSDVMQVDTPSSRKESSDSEEKKKKKKDKKNKKDKDGDKKRKHDDGEAEEKANGGDNNDSEKKSAKKLKKEKKSAKKEKK